MREARLTMNAYGIEQGYRIRKEIPPLDVYSEYRQGSSCMGMNVALIEYVTAVAHLITHLSDQAN